MIGATLAIHGCTGSDDPVDTTEIEGAATTQEDGGSTPTAQLPLITSTSSVVAELLDKPTAAGETTALHVKLPPPLNRQLQDSLVRVIGPTDSPQVLFKSDALARLGVIKRSPGKEFFTAFSSLDPKQLETLLRNQDEIKSGVFGRTTSESLVFAGRAANARTLNPAINPGTFVPGGGFTPVHNCSIRPVSTTAAWGKSLFITHPDVVLDHDRTWDPCTGNGTQGGVWTFAHLIREMANGSGKTPEQFVLDWLSMWLNPYTVNSDTVPSRTTMFSEVIEPWATASGTVAELKVNPVTGKLFVDLNGGTLDLDIAPFRLLAIVNRIDLGETVDGPAGYSGTATSRPKDAGELRFIFGVVEPSPWGAGTEATCGRKPFTVIFEYGVPIEGCTKVVQWAKKWTQLQAFSGFTAGYKTLLESMTQSVVLHGAAPTKGNQNAINQIRTNEIGLGIPLGQPWELREFTLSIEHPSTGAPDTPANGGLRAHTVAMTPNDGAFPATSIPGDPTINNFVVNKVLPTVDSPCSSSYEVPFKHLGVPFRGGNALIPPGFWRTSSVTAASPADNICARHEFSLNTCHGCHRNDSGTTGLGGSTSFTHVDPQSAIPVKLSKFLTGGGPGLTFNVNDPQLGASVVWKFADLERRFQRLFDLSHCTSCLLIPSVKQEFIAEIQKFGPLPGDPRPEELPDVRVGPITDLSVVQRLLEIRTQFVGDAIDNQVDFLRGINSATE